MCNKHFSSANGYSVQVIKFLAKGVPFERISWGITSDSTASRLVRLETFAALQAVGLNELLIGCERLLRFRQAPNPAVSLKHPAQEGQRLVRVTLQEKGVAEMIAGDRISGANLQLGAEFRGRRFEIALTKVYEANEIVRFGETRIELKGGFQLVETACIILLLGVGLSEEKMNGRVGGILFEQAAENLRGLVGLTRSNEGGAPGKKQSRVVRRRLEKRLEHFGGLREIVRQARKFP